MEGIAGSTLVAFAVTCLVIELTPGPNMAYLAILSAEKGRRSGFAATVGIAIGLLAIGIAAALGLAAIVANSRWLYESIRWAGTLYLLFLAWEAWRGEETSAGHTEPTFSETKYFARGLITNTLNPKAALFYVAVLPTFLDAGRPLAPQAIILSALYVAIATTVHTSIVLLADSARPWLTDETRSTHVRRLMAIALASISVWLFVSTRQA